MLVAYKNVGFVRMLLVATLACLAEARINNVNDHPCPMRHRSLRL